MKRVLTFLLGCCLLLSLLPAQTQQFLLDGQVESFSYHSELIVLKLRPEVGFAQQQALLAAEPALEPLQREQLLPAPRLTLVKVRPGLSTPQLEALLQRLASQPAVLFAHPFLQYQDGSLQAVTDELFAKLRPGTSLDDFQRLLSAYPVEVVEENPYDPGRYLLRVQPGHEPADLIAALQQSGRFAYVEPNFLRLLKPFASNDPLYDYQWSLENTGSGLQFNGTPDADMDVDDAWALTTGDPNVRVAIIDEGVDLDHPDLIGNVVGGFDATDQGSGGNPTGSDAHGTACAGIVAASGNNNLGISGVAPGSKILGVRIAYSFWFWWITNDNFISNGVNWAWNQGQADILSNSWGGGSPSSAITGALNNAVANGRNGLGSVVLFAAGNDDGAVSYPATLNNVIAVAAMSMCNERKSPTSCDGETFWGSNYGPGVDVAAPGVKIATTDIAGGSGYQNGDYTFDFNGTSSACPNAAGVMALILSLDPNLTLSQARAVLESTCAKVGGYTYGTASGQPNGSWSNDLGYGCVNAFDAVQAVGGVQPCALSVSLSGQDISCNNLSDGSATATPANGAAPYTYDWSHGATGQTASNLTAGTYTVTVTDGSGCSASGSLTLTEPAPVSTSISTTDESAPGANDGSADLSVSGGTAPYSYAWSNGVTSQDLNGVPGGVYTVVVSDANGCSREDQAVIDTGQPCTLSVSVGGSDVSCSGGNDGTASATPTGAAGSVSYLWSNGATGANISGLSAGTYSVQATDADGCQANGSVILSEPSPLNSSVLATNETLPGANDGSLDLTVSGGTPGYTYLWSNGATSEDLSGLAPGTYSVTLTDANGCTTTDQGTVEPAPLCAGIPVSASGTDVSCFGANDGTASASASGTPPFSYLWSNGATSQSLSGLAAGTYSVTVTDAAGCEGQASVTLSEPAALSSSIVATNESLPGANDGSLDLTVSGGTPGYTYLWSNGASSEDLNGLAPGTYSVTLTDANGCTTTDQGTVEPAPLCAGIPVSASGTDVSCFGANDGTATASASGTPPFSYLWSNGATSQSISGLAAGTYSVTVTDAAGCEGQASVSLSEPAALTSSILGTDASAAGASDGSADLTVSGGTSPYSFLWSNGATTEDLTGLAAGTYSVTLTDANGCTATDAVTIGEPSGGGGGLTFEAGMVAGVDDNWQSISLANSYTNMVVVASVVMAGPNAPTMVTRVDNANGSSFDLRVQVPNGATAPSTLVYYLVAEAGVYDLATYGVQMEAVKFTSTATSGKNSWSTEPQSYQQSYSSPVVVGQVMSANNAAWSAFWASDPNNRSLPITPSGFSASKHVGEDPNSSRSPETIGYMVFEGGSGSINGMSYSAGLGPQTVGGIYRSTSGYPYALSGLTTADIAVVSPGMMDGNDGYTAVLFGSNPVAGDEIITASAEDQVGDNERGHKVEQLSYVAVDGPGSFAPQSGWQPQAAGSRAGSLPPLSLYPNPASQELHLRFGQELAQPVALTLIDLTGRAVFTWQRQALAGLNELTIELPELAEGSYLLRLTSGEAVQYRRFQLLR